MYFTNTPELISNDLILATVCSLSDGVAVCATALHNSQLRAAPSGKWKLQLTLHLM